MNEIDRKIALKLSPKKKYHFKKKKYHFFLLLPCLTKNFPINSAASENS